MQDLKIYRDADFQWFETLPGKPSLMLEGREQHQTPADIIGFGNELRLIKRHLQSWPKTENWSAGDIQLVATLYKTLRRHGWYGPHLDELGRVCFGSPYKNKENHGKN